MKLTDTRLYRRLASLCDQNETGQLNGRRLIGAVEDAAAEMADLLNRACGNFEDYTLHDEAHAIRVITLMHRLMGDELTERLNPVELSLLILSAYAHDTGMAVGRKRREDLEASQGYRDYLLRNERAWEEAEAAKRAGDVKSYTFRSSMLFQDYLRRQHHVLSRELVEGELSSRFEVEGKSLARYLGMLCESHGQSMAWVAEHSPEPFAVEFMLDLPFLACVLRLADYLDLDASRAPRSLFALIDPGSEVSRREWRKHQASNFFVDETRIKFNADFDDFFEEKALRDTLKGIEQERRDCMEFLQQRPGEELYKLRLTSKVDSESIASRGYRYEEFRFQLEYREIMSLLMGVRLYRDERVFMRELLQNALDACRHADAAARKEERQGYKGLIRVRRTKRDGHDVLEVSDNGAGMTRSIIRDYFMRVGRSYYQSFAFRRRGLELHPVSQFGIGILSCFMKGSRLEVETAPDRSVYADASENDLKPRRLDIHGPHEFFVVHEENDLPSGTTVRVFLDQPLVGSLRDIVARFAGRLPYEIELQDDEKPPELLRPIPYDFDHPTFRGGFSRFPDAFGYKSRDLTFGGRLGFELSGVMRFFLLDAGGRRHLRLTDAGSYAEVGFGDEGETLLVVKRFDDVVRREIDAKLAPVRAAAQEVSGALREDILSLLRNFDLMCEFLAHQHDAAEVGRRWESIVAQVNAISESNAFRVSPSCIGLGEDLRDAVAELQSFINGRLVLSPPHGLVTQDGINVTAIANLPTRLKLGVGYLYNIDLCGEHKLSLTASRDEVITDERLAALVQRIQQAAGSFLGDWFKEEEINPSDVETYAASVPSALADAVLRAFRG
ncbi:MAG: hypothetical protein AAF266_04850 [Planctomycetota bacterium]